MDAVRQAAGLNGGQCVVDPGAAGRPAIRNSYQERGAKRAEPDNRATLVRTMCRRGDRVHLILFELECGRCEVVFEVRGCA